MLFLLKPQNDTLEMGTKSISSLISCITLSRAEALPQRTGVLSVKRSTSSPELAIHNVVTGEAGCPWH